MGFYLNLNWGPLHKCGADLVQHAVRVCGVLCVVDCVKCEEAWCVCE